MRISLNIDYSGRLAIFTVFNAVNLGARVFPLESDLQFLFMVSQVLLTSRSSLLSMEVPRPIPEETFHLRALHVGGHKITQTHTDTDFGTAAPWSPGGPGCVFRPNGFTLRLVVLCSFLTALHSPSPVQGHVAIVSLSGLVNWVLCFLRPRNK